MAGRFPTFRALRHTPLTHLVRGRLTEALDWRGLIDAAELPEPLRARIRGVVKRTRLWRRERAEVARELIAHFQDALEAQAEPGDGGRSDDALLARFGDPRTAARLIRRAKRRGRPLWWHTQRRMLQALGLFAGLYLLAALYLLTGKPEPSVDYLARLNAPIEAAPDEDKAWPIYREALIQYKVNDPDDPLIPDTVSFDPGARPGDPDWPRLVEILQANPGLLDAIRRDAAKPILGYPRVTRFGDLPPRDRRAVYGSVEPPPPNPYDGDVARKTGMEDLVIGVNLQALSSIRFFARLLTADANLARLENDSERWLRDIDALLGLARQNHGPFLISQLVSLSIDRLAAREAAALLEEDPSLLSDQQLRDLAHLLGNADSILQLNFVGERFIFYDVMQRSYDPASGYLTIDGLRWTGRLIAEFPPAPPDRSPGLDWLVLPAAAAMMPRYQDMRAAIDQLYDSAAIAAESPYLWPPGDEAWDHRVGQLMEQFPLGLARYSLLGLIPAVDAARQTFTVAQAVRDALLVAIALKTYQRDHGGRYPEELQALVPAYLPEVPIDRTAPEGVRRPLRFVVRDGVPHIYALGFDQDDDAGRPIPSARAWPSNYEALGQRDDEIPDGDWLLFPIPEQEE